MLTCPDCSSRVLEGDGFCEGCGHALPPPCRYCGLALIGADGFCSACGSPQTTGRDHMEIDRYGVAGVTDRGLRHRMNEDAMSAVEFPYRNRPAVAAVVCDGVSNSPRPESASQVAAETGTQVLARHLGEGVGAEAATSVALRSAARAVGALATSVDDAPACTYVSAVVSRDSVTVGWVGDSRAYWLAGDHETRSTLLTKDDSLLNHLTETGGMSREEAIRHPGSAALVQWLGADAEDLQPHVVSFEPDAPGVVLVCSDGLYSYLPEPDSLAAAAADAARATLPAARSLVQIALDGGGHDNITVLLIPFPPKGGQRR